MQYARIVTKTLVLVFAAATSAAAQSASDPPDGLGVLKNVELTYGAMTTYSAKATNTMEMSSSGTQSKVNMQTAMTVTGDSAGRFRMESKGMVGMLVVYDGNTMWLYMPSANSYSELVLNGASASAEAGVGAGMGMFGPGANALLEYKNVTAGVKEAKVLRSEKLNVNESEADCWVIALEYEPVRRQASADVPDATLPADLIHSIMIWVDKSRYLIYQEDSTSKMTLPRTNAPITIRQKSTADSITVDERVSPNVFAFTPPPDAVEMDHSAFNPKVELTQQSRKQ